MILILRLICVLAVNVVGWKGQVRNGQAENVTLSYDEVQMRNGWQIAN
jgi:hypothetical protein